MLYLGMASVAFTAATSSHIIAGVRSVVFYIDYTRATVLPLLSLVYSLKYPGDESPGNFMRITLILTPELLQHESLFPNGDEHSKY